MSIDGYLLYDFYPRPPRGGRLQRAQAGNVEGSDFYPRPPRGGRHQDGRDAKSPRRISIHALREEGDSQGVDTGNFVYAFLSTPSARRATLPLQRLYRSFQISIHALREEGDIMPGKVWNAPTWYFYPRPPRGGRPLTVLSVPTHTHFYPRPPRGGRRYLLHNLAVLIEFLSTPSARRATISKCKPAEVNVISIHALREEGDALQHRPWAASYDFYPRPPRGGRRQQHDQPVR